MQLCKIYSWDTDISLSIISNRKQSERFSRMVWKGFACTRKCHYFERWKSFISQDMSLFRGYVLILKKMWFWGDGVEIISEVLARAILEVLSQGTPHRCCILPPKRHVFMFFSHFSLPLTALFSFSCFSGWLLRTILWWSIVESFKKKTWWTSRPTDDAIVKNA